MKIIKTSLWLFVALVISACQKDDKFINTGCCYNEPVAGKLGNASIYLPTIFTPNGDDVNDYFLLFGDSIDKVVLFEIRNTRDKLVFQAKDVDANDYTKGWDGKVNGKVVKGLYSVTLVVEALDGTIGEYESTVCNYPCGQSEELSSIGNCHYPSQWYCWKDFEGCYIEEIPECFE